MPGWSDSPGARGAPADLPADRLERGSREDLRQRLNLLPSEHPSSPRNADLAERRQHDHADRRHPDRVDPRSAHDQQVHEADELVADQPARDYWSEVPRFRQLWAEHVSRWPERGEKDKVDRSRDPSGSWRGDGNQYLSPEQHDQAQAVIATVRAAEESISGHMQEIERENTCGSRLAGWDHRRKGDTRLKEKIAEEYGITPGLKSSGAMDGIHDAIRYTYCSKAADYADAFWNIKGLLESHGYRMNYSKNHWHSGQEYKGVNTRWTTPDNLSFEVQFHTPESFDAKQRITHSSYERGRNPLTTRSERRAIKEFHQVVYSLISAPDGSTGIPDHKEVG